jgi:hypothetical protein
MHGWILDLVLPWHQLIRTRNYEDLPAFINVINGFS